MANHNLEELILAGSNDLSLLAKNFTKDEIESAKTDIEKKNPDVNVLPDAGESVSGDTSLESAPATAKQDTSIAKLPDWLAGNVPTQEIILENIYKDENITSELQRRGNEINEITSRIKADKYKDITEFGVASMYGLTGSTRVNTAYSQKEKDKKALQEAQLSLIDFNRRAYTRVYSDIVEETYRQKFPEPPKYAAGEYKGESVAWAEWVSRAKEMESLLYDQEGMILDLDDDGYVGKTKGVANDLWVDVRLAINTAADIGVFGIGLAATGGGNLLDDASVRKYAVESNKRRKQLMEERSLRASGFADDMEFSSLSFNKSLGYLDEFLSSAIESSPYTAAAIGIGTVASPVASVGALSYLSGARAYYQAKLDSSFDKFFVNGQEVDPINQSNLLSRIQKYYESEDFEIRNDGDGDYIELEGPFGPQKVFVEQDNAARWGYAAALGIAEGLPEALGTHIVMKGVESFLTGNKQPLTNIMQGYLKASMTGVLPETAQEFATEFMTVLADAAIKGEYISVDQALARMTQAAATGGLSGSAVGPVVFGGKMIAMGREGREVFFGSNEIARALAGKVDALPVVDFETAQQQQDVLAALNGQDITDFERGVLEDQLQDFNAKIETKNQQLQEGLSRLYEVDPMKAIEVSKNINELNAINQAVKANKDIVTRDLAKAGIQERLDALRESIARDLTGIQTEPPEVLETAEQLSAELQVSAESIGKKLGKTAEEAQALMDSGIAPTALLAAANLAGKEGNVIVYESRDEFLQGAPDPELANRQKSIAQFDPKTGTIHVTAQAGAKDVLEEAAHRKLDEGEFNFDEMAEELLNSENAVIRAIAEQRRDEYSDSKDVSEEIVVGVLRESPDVEFESSSLNAINKDLKDTYKLEVAAAQQATPITRGKYEQTMTTVVQSAVNNLQERVHSIGLDINDVAESVGVDMTGDLTLQDLDKITNEYNRRVPLTVEGALPKNAQLTNPELRLKLQEFGLTDENGRLNTSLPTILMKLDELGNVTINGRQYFSGIDAEQIRSGAGINMLLASTNKGTATKFYNLLRELVDQSGSNNFLVLYEVMGEQAAQTSVIYTDKGISNLLAKEGATKEDINALIAGINGLEEVTRKSKGVEGGYIISYREVLENPPNKKNPISKSQKKYYVAPNKKAADAWIREQNRNKKSQQKQGGREGEIYQAEYLEVEGKPQKATEPFSMPVMLRDAIANLKTGNSAQKQQAYREILEYLLNKNISSKMTIEQRDAFNAPLVDSYAVDMSEIRSEKLTEQSRGNVVAGVVGSLVTNSIMGGQEIDLEDTQRSQYSYGIATENSSYFDFETPFKAETLNFDDSKIHDNKKWFNNQIVENLVEEEAAEDKKAAKDSRFMGLPETPFTMSYTEEVVNSAGTYSNQVFRQKEFQDGWHFWNWWVLQTGNGKVKQIGGWGYFDESGQFKRLVNIPQKKDRNTGAVLEVEPLFRNNQQRKIDTNKREISKRKVNNEMLEAENSRIEQELKDKTKDSNISYGLLFSSASLEHVSLNAFFRANERNHYLKSMSNLFDVMTDSNSMEQGDRIQFSPLMSEAPSYQRHNDEQFENLIDVELGSLEVVTDFAREDVLQTGKVVNFFRNYARFNDPNIVNSIEKTENGWKLSVNLKVSDANQKMVDDYNTNERPKSREDVEAAIHSFKYGSSYEPKASRIMPPRYYDLKNDRGAFKGTIDFLNTWMVDKYAEILGLQEQVEKQKGRKVPQSQNFKEIEQLMYGRSRYAMEQLDQKMQAAKQFMMDNGITHTDLSQYMYARHAEERNAHIAKKRPDLLNGSGMSNEAAAEVLSKLDTKEIKEAAAMFDAIIDDTRKTMKDYGLESQERLDAWDQLYQHYVPLQGFADDEMEASRNAYPTGGAGMSVYGSKVKAAIGRESEAANVLANIVMQNAVIHQWAEKNRVLESLHDLVKKNPMEDVWSIVDAKVPLTKLDENGRQVPMTIMEMHADPNTVPVRINGEQKFIRFQDPYYADVLNGMTMEQTNTFLRAMRAPVSWLRGVFTQWDPNFFVSNFARDIGGSIYTASSDLDAGVIDNVNTKGFQKKMFGNTFRSLNALLGEAVRGKELPAELQKFYDEWKEDGGQTGWNYVKDLKEIEAELAVNADDLTRGKQLREKLFSSPKKFFEFVEGVNDAFENSIRLSAYMTARQQGASRQQAAVFSKNITVNFNKQGEAGPAINTMYLFFNAAIQGNKRVYESITRVKPPVRPDGSTREWYERATGAQKVAAGMAGFTGMLTLLNIAMSGRDPEDDELWYNKVSEYDKQRNMIICYGPERDDFLKIPLPYGFGLFNNMGLALAETSTGNRTTNEALMFLGTSAFSAFSPISFGGDADNPGTFVLRSFAPTTLKPFVELAENRTYFGSPITGEQLPFGTPVPSSELSFRAPQEIQTFFEWMNQATGGSQFKSGWADFNPDYTWYLFEYFVGGSGDFVLSTGEQSRNLMEMSKRSIEKAKESGSVGELIKALGYGFSEEGQVRINYNDIPIAKKIYGEASPFYDIEAFKDNSMEVEQLFREIKENKLVQEPGRYNGVQTLHEDYQQANKTLKILREALREARDIEDYIDRQNRIFDLYEAQRKVMARYNKKYKELRGQN